MTNQTKGLFTIFLALALSACSNDEVVPGTDAGTVDMTTMNGDADIDMGVSPDLGSDAGTDPCAVTSLLVTTSDFSTGFMGRVGLSTNALIGTPVATSDQDSVPMRSGCTTFVLEHGTGNVLVQSATDPLATAHTIELTSDGAFPYASNPLSVASISATKAYVTQGSLNAVAIINPTLDGAAAVTGTIDLSGFVQEGDTDTHVDMSAMVIVGTKAYVALGNYYFNSEFAQVFAGPSMIAVIDTATDTLVDQDASVDGVQAIELSFHNPVELVVDGTDIYVAVAGLGDAQDGGIELVDTTTGDVSTVITEEALMGTLSTNPAGIAIANETLFVISGWTYSGGGTVYVIDRDPVARGTALGVTNANSLRASGNTLYVSAATPAALRVFSAATLAETTPAAGAIMVGTQGVYGVAEAP